jgi:G3E family GTPase
VPGSSDRPDVQSAVFRSTRSIKSELINHFLDQLIPLTIRIKGHLLLDNGTSLSVQTIADELHTEIIPLKTRQTELIAMGYQISVHALKDLYQECV